MIKDIGKAAYWIVVTIIALFIVSAVLVFGLEFLFSPWSLFFAVVFAPMLLMKVAASGAPEAKSEGVKVSKENNVNTVKFNIMK